MFDTLVQNLFGGGGGAGAGSSAIRQGIDGARQAIKSYEGLPLSVKGDQEKALRPWAEKMQAFTDLPTDPTVDQMETMTMLAGGSDTMVTQYTNYYTDAQKVLGGMGRIANSALALDAAVTQQGMTLLKSQMTAADRIMKEGEGLHRQSVQLRGLATAVGGQGATLRQIGARLGNIM
jgi:hypothetical protein